MTPGGIDLRQGCSVMALKVWTVPSFQFILLLLVYDRLQLGVGFFSFVLSLSFFFFIELLYLIWKV